MRLSLPGLPNVRWLGIVRFAAVAIGIALTATACGDGPAAPPTVTPTVDQTPIEKTGLPVFGPADQNLLFQGVVEGQMTDSDASCAWLRGPTPEKGRFQMLFQAFMSGERHSVRVVINGYTGPGEYSWDGVPGSGPEVTVEVDSKQRGHAHVFVAEPGDNGDLEATISSPGQGRITGQFQCPGVPK